MIPHRLSLKNVLIVTVVLSLILFLVLIKVTGASVEGAMMRMGFIITSISFFWWYFEKIGWSQGIFRIGGWLCDLPDLRGRWEGVIDRVDEGRPHKFVLEIRQSATKLACYAYTSRSRSRSIACEIVSDYTKESYQLVHTWQSEAGPLEGQERTGIFYGTSVLNISTNDGKLMCGNYFTQREPAQTRGELKLEWKSNDLLDKFE